MTETAIIGLGSNRGNRLRALRGGLRQLNTRAGALIAVSHIYLTEPILVTEQRRFLNAAAAIHTTLQPAELLQTVKQIEWDLGRRPGTRYGPRVMDLDILFYGNHRIEQPDLTVPHPGIHRRAFVLRPLIDLAALAEVADNQYLNVMRLTQALNRLKDTAELQYEHTGHGHFIKASKRTT